MTEFEEYVLDHIKSIIINDISDYSYWDAEDLDEDEWIEVQEIMKRVKLTLEEINNEW